MTFLQALGYIWATQHPVFYIVPLSLGACAGYFVGLRGYAQASRDAYTRVLAAQQRSRLSRHGS